MGNQVHQVFLELKDKQVIVVPVARWGFQASKERKVFCIKYVNNLNRNRIQSQLLKFERKVPGIQSQLQVIL